MKKLSYIVVLVAPLLVGGCMPVTSPRDAPPREAVLNSPATSTQAKQGMDNASITQQIMKNRRLPDGTALPQLPGPKGGK